eukprot:gene7285-9714_t
MAGKLEFSTVFDDSTGSSGSSTRRGSGSGSHASGHHEGQLMLMQVDEHVIKALQHQRESVYFVATENEPVVLCTDSRTYSVKHADVSNAHYIVSPFDDSNGVFEFSDDKARTVEANVRSYFELSQINPRLHRVDELLSEASYRGEDETGDAQEQKKYSLNTLMDLVQASRDEIMEYLQSRHAFELDGFWHILDTEYSYEVMDVLLQVSDERGWISSGVPETDCVATMSENGIRKEVTLAVLHELADKEDFQLVWNLNEESVCRFRAAEILQIGTLWNYQSFFETLNASMPSNMTAKREYLKGLGLVTEPNESNIQRSIQYFPASNLPVDPKQRFDVLFNTKPVWTAQEIEPYLQGISSPLQPMEQLLMRYARAFEGKSGMRMYNRK